MPRKRILAALCTLWAVLAVAALVTGVTPTRAALYQGSQTLTIGVIGPVDGPTLRGVSLAVDEANARGVTLPTGEPFTLQVVAIDAGDQVEAAIRQLVQTNVVALFGPDDNASAVANIVAMSTADVPVFTAATSTDVRTGGFLFRTRASDNVRMNALADFMLNDVGARNFTVYQGNEQAGSPTAAFALALASRGIAASPVLQDPTRPVADAVPVLLQNQPDAVVAFGEPAQVGELYLALREAGFAGAFATDVATHPDFKAALPPMQRSGIYGITAWSYAWPTDANTDFLLNYARTFGELPDAQAAAAYDAANGLIAVIERVGSTPSAVLASILSVPPQQSLQGTFNPTLGAGETTNDVIIFETNLNGAPSPVARYAGAERLTLDIVPPATPTPEASATPTVPPLPPTPVASPTPAGVIGTVLSDFLNVRPGPGVVYQPVLGQLQRGEQVQLLGTVQGYQWFVINFRGQQAWISGDPTLLSLFGDVFSLPLVPIPATPTPVATPTPIATATPITAINLVAGIVEYGTPTCNVPFTLGFDVANLGTQASPGGWVSMRDIRVADGQIVIDTAAQFPAIAPGQTVRVNFPLNISTYYNETHRFSLIIDGLNQIPETNEGDNIREVEYVLQKGGCP